MKILDLTMARTANKPKVKISNNRLQIVLTWRGVRRYHSLHLSDSVRNRQHADFVAQWMQNDILSHSFDPTFKRYKQQDETPGAVISEISISDLWERYTIYKRPQLAASTIAKDFDRVATLIGRFPVTSLRDAVAVRDYLNSETTPNTTRRVLTQLNAACKWGVKSRTIASNPFDGMAADIKLPKGSEKPDIDPFSPEERDLIIDYFKKYNQPFAPLVEFIFRTGCRPSEATGLVWRNISVDFKTVTFTQAVTLTEDGLAVKQGLKTQERRVFPCGDTLQTFLRSIAPEDIHRDRFVFESDRGKFIDFHNFTNRHWHPVLTTLGIAPRSPYQMRHSYITFCIRSGMDAANVAKLVGNSPEIIYKHYMGVDRNLVAPGF
jgi:integrase